MECKICAGPTVSLFQHKVHVLLKYPVTYFQCSSCRFIQTEAPYWLPEAYSSAITSLDIGLVRRNVTISKIMATLISLFFNPNATFIDYGGGYGMLVRLMRDLGFDFYRHDIHCENIFSNYFDVTNTPKTKFELLGAFEVFEHLDNPLAEIEKMLQLSDSIFFSTEVVPERKIRLPSDWWYFTPETGQHIALYSVESLQLIAKKFGCNLYTNRKTLHLITRKKINPILFGLAVKGKVSILLSKVLGRKSLLMQDYEFIRQTLNKA